MDVVDHAKNDPKLSHGVFSANGYALCLCWRLCSPLTAMQLYCFLPNRAQYTRNPIMFRCNARRMSLSLSNNNPLKYLVIICAPALLAISMF